MLARGGTTGVFQFESSLATDKLRAMKCDRFEDLVATNALIRPGPLDRATGTFLAIVFSRVSLPCTRSNACFSVSIAPQIWYSMSSASL